MSAITDHPNDQLTITAMAHGGEGIARTADGRVVFVAGTVLGDTVRVEYTTVKKRWSRARLVEVLEPSLDRIDPTCPAAAHGAGCCDYSHIDPSAQLRLKKDVLVGQLSKLAGMEAVLDEFEAVQLEPQRGWRTRVRLGIDRAGRAGMRRAGSADIVADIPCTQPIYGLLDGIVGPNAPSFTPGAELIAVSDSTGRRHAVETARAQRGRRIETTDAVIMGNGTVSEKVGEHVFHFPATAFWQAHRAAPEAYSEVIRTWAAGDYAKSCAWDLYSGVGAFVPAIADAIGHSARIDAVDYSPSASRLVPDTLESFDVRSHNATVEKVDGLGDPGLVVLDPPRSGAGASVVRKIAEAHPERVIHIGCDPATFARDLGYWGENGFAVTRMKLIDAFPNTHHFEIIAALEPAHGATAQ